MSPDPGTAPSAEPVAQPSPVAANPAPASPSDSAVPPQSFGTAAAQDASDPRLSKNAAKKELNLEFDPKLADKVSSQTEADLESETRERRTSEKIAGNTSTRIRGVDAHYVVTGPATFNVYEGTAAPAGTAAASQISQPWPASAYAACCDNLDDVAFLVGAACLHGLSIGTVRVAAANLAQQLAQEVKPPSDAPTSPPRFRSVDLLFEQFRVQLKRGLGAEKDQFFTECVEFNSAADAEDILRHAWTRLQGFPNWLNHLTSWLLGLGLDRSLEVRVAVGRSAGILWASGVEQIETDIVNHWVYDESTRPLDAVDGCFSAAANASARLRERTGDKLWAWGNISHGIDGVFALGRLSTRAYRKANPTACFRALRALLGKNNLVGFLHAQEAYERLLIVAITEPSCANDIAMSLLEAFNDAGAKKDQILRLQTIAVGLSLIEADGREKGKRFFIFDEVLKAAPELTELARLVNAVSAPSPMQASARRALRALFMRGVDEGTLDWSSNHVLKLFARMHAEGSAAARGRLESDLTDWTAAAADRSAAAGSLAEGLLVYIMERGHEHA